MATKKKRAPNKKKIKALNVNIKGNIEESLPQLRYSQNIPVYDVLEDCDINTDSGLSECFYDLLVSNKVKTSAFRRIDLSLDLC